MQIIAETKEKTAVFKLIGNLAEFGNADRFGKTILAAVTPEMQAIVHNFNESSLLDSRFIGKMLEIYGLLKNQIKFYVVCNKNEAVADVMQICGLQRFVSFLPSDDAIPS